jgi:hypothetical protein
MTTRIYHDPDLRRHQLKTQCVLCGYPMSGSEGYVIADTNDDVCAKCGDNPTDIPRRAADYARELEAIVAWLHGIAVTVKGA